MVKKSISPLDFRTGGVKKLPRNTGNYSTFIPDGAITLGANNVAVGFDTIGVTTTLDLHNTMVVGEDIDTPNGFNNGIITNNLIVTDNAELPPRDGNVRVRVDELSDVRVVEYFSSRTDSWWVLHESPLSRPVRERESTWSKIKYFFRKLISPWS